MNPKIRDNCRKNQSAVDQPEEHPLLYAYLTDLLQIVESYWNDLFPPPTSVDIAALWRMKNARNPLKHGRDVSESGIEDIKLAARGLWTALGGTDSELSEALDAQMRLGSDRSSTVFVPAVDLPGAGSDRPLDSYYGFVYSLLERRGLKPVVVSRETLTEEVFVRNLEQCRMIWIPSPIAALAFDQLGWFDHITRHILAGKPTLLQTQGPQYRDAGGPTWMTFLDKLGLRDYENLRILDYESNDGDPRTPIFTKQNECLRDAALFDGVDSLTVSDPHVLEAGERARHVVVGGPTATVLDWREDQWTASGGGRVACVATATHTVIPGSALRVLAISGYFINDPAEAMRHVSSLFLNNLGFALNALDWLVGDEKSSV